MTNNDLRRYLLGDADEDHGAEVEREYFADEEAFDRLVEAEHDLVDAYVEGSLSAADRTRFEQHFLSTTARREQLDFARALRQRIGGASRRVTVRPTAFYRLAAAVLFALVGLGAAWLFLSTRQTEVRPQVASRPVHARPATPPAAAVAETVMTILLSPVGTRESDSARSVVIPAGTDSVQLQLPLDANRYRTYATELQDVEGRVLWSGEPLEASRGMVSPKLPAKIVAPGDYVVVLFGVRDGRRTEVANYTFSVR